MQKSLVFIGDSLTAWFDWQRRFPAYDVQNLGISGETVEGLLDRREWVRSRITAPDYLFLMTGINNIAMEQYDIEAPYQEVVRNFTTWYKQATVVVQSLLPVTLEWISNDTIRQTNRCLAAIAREYGAEYLDLHPLFIDGEGNPESSFLSDDGIHVSSRGYGTWADEVERFLKQKERRPR